MISAALGKAAGPLSSWLKQKTVTLDSLAFSIFSKSSMSDCGGHSIAKEHPEKWWFN